MRLRYWRLLVEPFHFLFKVYVCRRQFRPYLLKCCVKKLLKIIERATRYANGNNAYALKQIKHCTLLRNNWKKNLLISPTKRCSHQKRQKFLWRWCTRSIRDDITAESLDNLTSNCEIVWTKIHFARNKSIYFASNYRPPSDHLESLEALQASLTKLYRSQKTQRSYSRWLQPTWHHLGSQQTINTRTASKHNKLLEIISEFGLQNTVNDPTRIESGNILDLILTSNIITYRPTHILTSNIITNRPTHTTAGISDHEAVTFEVNLNLIRNRKPPHKVSNQQTGVNSRTKYLNW